MNQTQFYISNRDPILVLWDGSINSNQEELIRATLNSLYDSIGFDKSYLHYLDDDWLEKHFKIGSVDCFEVNGLEKKVVSSIDLPRNQVYFEKFYSLEASDSIRITQKPGEVIFTNRDIFSLGNSYLIGAALGNITLISFFRLNGISDPYLCKATIQTEIFHEVGHILNLPSKRRGLKELEDSIGLHCTNSGCSMKQGLDVPRDWINNTIVRIQNGGVPYCPECIKDLEKLEKDS